MHGHKDLVWSLTMCRGRVCSGSDTTIRVWNMSTLETERILEGHSRTIRFLASWGGWLVSGADDRSIRVWDVTTGQCRAVLDEHSASVLCLAVVDDLLLSGSDDCSVKVWRMLDNGICRCERTLKGHEDLVYSLVGWEGHAISGSADRTIRVYKASTGEQIKVLHGHDGRVWSLVMCGRNLVSASVDKTVRVWSTDTWSCIQVLFRPLHTVFPVLLALLLCHGLRPLPPPPTHHPLSSQLSSCGVGGSHFMCFARGRIRASGAWQCAAHTW